MPGTVTEVNEAAVNPITRMEAARLRTLPATQRAAAVADLMPAVDLLAAAVEPRTAAYLQLEIARWVTCGDDTGQALATTMTPTQARNVLLTALTADPDARRALRAPGKDLTARIKRLPGLVEATWS